MLFGADIFIWFLFFRVHRKISLTLFGFIMTARNLLIACSHSISANLMKNPPVRLNLSCQRKSFSFFQLFTRKPKSDHEKPFKFHALLACTDKHIHLSNEENLKINKNPISIIWCLLLLPRNMPSTDFLVIPLPSCKVWRARGEIEMEKANPISGCFQCKYMKNYFIYSHFRLAFKIPPSQPRLNAI